MLLAFQDGFVCDMPIDTSTSFVFVAPFVLVRAASCALCYTITRVAQKIMTHTHAHTQDGQ